MSEITSLISHVDIIVARSITTWKLKQEYSNIQIVETPITVDDVVFSILSLKEKNLDNEPIAHVDFINISFQAQTASKLYNIPIHPFSYYDKNTYNR